jgi:hypothetical protein
VGGNRPGSGPGAERSAAKRSGGAVAAFLPGPTDARDRRAPRHQRGRRQDARQSGRRSPARRPCAAGLRMLGGRLGGVPSLSPGRSRAGRTGGSLAGFASRSTVGIGPGLGMFGASGIWGFGRSGQAVCCIVLPRLVAGDPTSAWGNARQSSHRRRHRVSLARRRRRGTHFAGRGDWCPPSLFPCGCQWPWWTV